MLRLERKEAGKPDLSSSGSLRVRSSADVRSVQWFYRQNL